MVSSLSPHGESGFKSIWSYIIITVCMSLPAWGEWIEIDVQFIADTYIGSSLPAWGEWIEIYYTC